jgi:hypothetical protein
MSPAQGEFRWTPFLCGRSGSEELDPDGEHSGGCKTAGHAKECHPNAAPLFLPPELVWRALWLLFNRGQSPRVCVDWLPDNLHITPGLL